VLLFTQLEFKMIYKHFQPDEVVGLDTALVQKLDSARDLSEVPFIITSGLRTEANEIAHGRPVPNSHTKGLAVDLRVDNDNWRYEILTSLFAVGFKRVGDEIDHIHADIDTSEAQNVVWLK